MKRASHHAVLLSLVACATLAASAAVATDHIDGGMSVDQPATDLTDLYAFTVAEDAQRLVIILNTVTAATDGARPAPDATFNIFIDSVAPDEESVRFQPRGDTPFRISCTWQDTGVRCTTSSGRQIETALLAVSDPADLRIFAGLRSDPFVLNGRWAVALQNGTTIPAPYDSNVIFGLNVYALVLEIDIASVLPDLRDSVLAIGADVRNGAGEVQDRIGRPEIANIALQLPGNADMRDALNREPAPYMSTAFRDQIAGLLRADLDRYDAFDPQPYQTDKDALAGLLADDFLTIDPRLPCSGARYFDLETALLSGTSATYCGGRPLDQDVIDAVYGLLIHGTTAQEVSDGADTATHPPLATFPYLAPPNTGWQSALRARAARALANVSVPGPKRIQTAVFGGVFLLAILTVIIVGIRRLIARRR
ncbi:hypothetical protein A8B78_12035 [Jannaschia sp. EhC01]|nr:hypothetical protein A8B78_12035 [Jannaschia sp. EhC01]